MVLTHKNFIYLYDQHYIFRGEYLYIYIKFLCHQKNINDIMITKTNNLNF